MVDSCKILAFITLLKLNRRNSTIYKNEKVYKIANKLKISVTTYKKLLAICISKRYIIEFKYGYQAIKLLTIMKDLGKFKYISFFKYYKWSAAPSYKDLYTHIQDELLLLNFKQQEYRIEKRKEIFTAFKESSRQYSKEPQCCPSTDQVEPKSLTDKKRKAIIKKTIKTAEKEGLSTEEYLDKITSEKNQKTIVSGKHHASKILGMCSSSGTRALKRLVERNKINRYNTTIKVNAIVNNYTYDGLKAAYGKATIIPVSRKNCYYIYLGSRIEIKKTSSVCGSSSIFPTTSSIIKIRTTTL